MDVRKYVDITARAGLRSTFFLVSLTLHMTRHRLFAVVVLGPITITETLRLEDRHDCIVAYSMYCGNSIVFRAADICHDNPPDRPDPAQFSPAHSSTQYVQ